MPVNIVFSTWESEHFRRRIYRVEMDPTATKGELLAAISGAPAHDLLEIVLEESDIEAVAVAIDCGFRPVLRFAHYSARLDEGKLSGTLRYARGWLKDVRRAVPDDIDDLCCLAGAIRFPGRFSVPPFTAEDGVDYYRLRVEGGTRYFR